MNRDELVLVAQKSGKYSYIVYNATHNLVSKRHSMLPFSRLSSLTNNSMIQCMLTPLPLPFMQTLPNIPPIPQPNTFPFRPFQIIFGKRLL